MQNEEVLAALTKKCEECENSTNMELWSCDGCLIPAAARALSFRVAKKAEIVGGELECPYCFCTFPLSVDYIKVRYCPNCGQNIQKDL